jgi:hypothetical protein
MLSLAGPRGRRNIPSSSPISLCFFSCRDSEVRSLFASGQPGTCDALAVEQHELPGLFHPNAQIVANRRPFRRTKGVDFIAAARFVHAFEGASGPCRRQQRVRSEFPGEVGTSTIINRPLAYKAVRDRSSFDRPTSISRIRRALRIRSRLARSWSRIFPRYFGRGVPIGLGTAEQDANPGEAQARLSRRAAPSPVPDRWRGPQHDGWSGKAEALTR